MFTTKRHTKTTCCTASAPLSYFHTNRGNCFDIAILGQVSLLIIYVAGHLVLTLLASVIKVKFVNAVHSIIHRDYHHHTLGTYLPIYIY